MRRRFKIQVPRYFGAAALVAGFCLSSSIGLAAAGKWDGKWVSNFVGPEDCEIGFSELTANISDQTLHLRYRKSNSIGELSTDIDPEGNVSAKLNLFAKYLFGSGAGNTDFVLAGKFRENTFSGKLVGRVSAGTNDAKRCEGVLEFARLGTVEAEALLTGEDVEVLKLEQQVASLRSEQVVSTGKWDGEWIGQFSGTVEQGCAFGADKDPAPKFESAKVEDNRFSVRLVDNGGPNLFSGDIAPSGQVDSYHQIEFSKARGAGEKILRVRLQGNFTGNTFLGELGASWDFQGNCWLNLEMARKDTLEAKALLTGQDVEMLRTEQKVAELSSQGLLRRAATVPTAQVDPSNPFDGIWHGIAKSDDENICRITDKIETVMVKDFSANLKLSSGNISATVDTSGALSKWLNVEAHDTGSDNEVTLNAKLDGTFKDGKFEGGLSANLDSGNVCTATVKLGPKGSIHAEALLTGKNPRLLALQRQIAAAQAAPVNDNNEAARAEAARLAAERKAEEERLAALKEEQERARAAEEAERAKRRQEEEALIAKLREAEQKRLAEARAAEEASLAKLKAEQERLAEQQRQLAAQRVKEAARLARLKAEADAKAEEIAALREQQSAKPKLNIPANINFGDYHALVIGINDYKNLESLKTAVADANAVAGLLVEKYGFKVTKLINPSRDDILDTLDDLRASLTFKDNLLVYYAGHGWLDNEADQGYWLASDAKKNRRSRWVSNASITDTLKAIKSKHVMVVADSCYSGRLVRDAAVQVENTDTPEYFSQMSRKKARVVITSGGLEPVEDGNGEHSPFARAFLKALNENDGVIDGSKLFSTIRRPVMVSANQTPQYSDVRRAGHDGGDFLFVRRK